MKYEYFLTAQQYVISDILIKEIVKRNLSLNEFLLLLYFHNKEDKTFDVSQIKNSFGLNDNEILESFNNLLTKKLIKIETDNFQGKIREIISLKDFYANLELNLTKTIKEENESNIYDIFEQEFERQLTPMELEIINAWLENNTSEEMIIGALKEAIYNGVKNFRYIDKIIYEWGKKGFKTMDDVKAHLKNTNKSPKKEELFDYDWLDDNEV